MAFNIKPFPTLLRVIFCKSFQTQSYHHVNKIDNYIEELVKEKSTKWKTFHQNIVAAEQRILRNQSIPPRILVSSFVKEIKGIGSLESTNLDIRKLSKHQLDSLIAATINLRNEQDCFYLINECIRYEIVPELKQPLTFLSYKGELNLILKLEEISLATNSSMSNYFLPYKGFAAWKQGNVTLTIKIFELFFESCRTNYIDAYRWLRVIVNDTFNEKGEAVLHSLICFANQVNEKYNEIYLLSLIWKNAFISNWFSDQQLSIRLIEENIELRQVITGNSKKLCAEFLKKNRPDFVYKIIELFLKYEKKSACEDCLHILFDYYYEQRSQKNCLEIFKFMEFCGISISQQTSEKMVNLLLKRDEPHYKVNITQPHKFHFKF